MVYHGRGVLRSVDELYGRLYCAEHNAQPIHTVGAVLIHDPLIILQGRASDKAIALDILNTVRSPSPQPLHIDTVHMTSIVNSTVSAPANSIVNSTISAPTTVGGNDTEKYLSPAFEGSDSDQDYLESEESDGMTPPSNLDDAFRASYFNFKSDEKWHLPSGSTVEDVLYEAYWNKKLRVSVRNSIRNWVLDIGSEKMENLFTKSDWTAIKAELPLMPVVDDKFARSLLRFSKV